MPENYGLKAIVPIVPARDMQRSLAFYTSLGFQAHPYGDGSQYAFLHMDRNALHLRRAGADEFLSNPGGVYIYVEDADRFYAHVLARGIVALSPIEDRPWNCREFAIQDPDGFLLRIGHTLR